MFDTCVENLAVRGRLIIIGYISEYLSKPELVTRERIYRILLSKSASLRAMFLLHFIRQVPEEVAKLLDLYKSGKLKVEVDPKQFYGVDQAADAVEYLHTGKSVGKVVVKFG